MPIDRRPLTDRVRAMLEARARPSREVRMFGGVSFMVDEKMVVSVRAGDGLLVRADPERNAELVALEGARSAEMGAGRAMGPSWIDVAGDALVSDEQVSFWIDVALEHHDQVAQ